MSRQDLLEARPAPISAKPRMRLWPCFVGDTGPGVMHPRPLKCPPPKKEKRAHTDITCLGHSRALSGERFCLLNDFPHVVSDSGKSSLKSTARSWNGRSCRAPGCGPFTSGMVQTWSKPGPPETSDSKFAWEGKCGEETLSLKGLRTKKALTRPWVKKPTGSHFGGR